MKENSRFPLVPCPICKKVYAYTYHKKKMPNKKVFCIKCDCRSRNRLETCDGNEYEILRAWNTLMLYGQKTKIIFDEWGNVKNET